MAFTEAEKAAWHAARRGDAQDDDPDDLPVAGTSCAHCGAPIPGGDDQDFMLCRACE